MIKLTLIPLVTFVLFSSCKSKQCGPNYITPVFVGFSPADIDTFVIREYKPNDNFLDLLDTVVITNPASGKYTTSNDTTVVMVNLKNLTDNYLSQNADWQIYIPSKNRTVSIASITAPQKEEGFLSDGYCVNPITSFMQDGQVTSAQQINSSSTWGNIGYVAYINN
jgi:hypothetical protein